MGYAAHILKVSTGEVRAVSMGSLNFDGSTEFWWTEGNAACDCNRRIWFEGEEEAERIQRARQSEAEAKGLDHWKDCGDDEYKLVKLVSDDGAVMLEK